MSIPWVFLGSILVGAGAIIVGVLVGFPTSLGYLVNSWGVTNPVPIMIVCGVVAVLAAIVAKGSLHN